MSMTITMDDALKTEFSQVCAEIGLSASAAFNVYAKKVVREKRIPFELTAQADAERERELEQEIRAYERDLNERLWAGYRQVQEGKVVSLDEVEALRRVREEAGYYE